MLGQDFLDIQYNLTIANSIAGKHNEEKKALKIILSICFLVMSSFLFCQRINFVCFYVTLFPLLAAAKKGGIFLNVETLTNVAQFENFLTDIFY